MNGMEKEAGFPSMATAASWRILMKRNFSANFIHKDFEVDTNLWREILNSELKCNEGIWALEFFGILRKF